MLRTSAAFTHRSAPDLLRSDSECEQSTGLDGRLRIFAFTFLLCIGMALDQEARGQAPADAARERRSNYEVVTQGLLANPILALEFRTAPIRLEIRDFIMGAGEARGVPIRGRTLMELRGGGVTTVIDGAKQERRPGDFWTVNQGSSLTLQNTGDVAVIRAIRIIEERK